MNVNPTAVTRVLSGFSPSRSTVSAIVATSIACLAFVYSTALTWLETGVALGCGGTCVSEAQYSLIVINPLLMLVTVGASALVGRLKSKLFYLTRLLSLATFCIVVAPLCVIGWSVIWSTHG